MKKKKSTGNLQAKVGHCLPPIETQFQPGQSGNPEGRPPGSKNRSTIARKILQMKGALPKETMDKLKQFFPEINNSMTIEEIMTIKMTAQAITKGDTQAYKAVMDSGYGNPNQSVSGPDEKPIKLTIVPTLEELKSEAKARGLPTTIFK